MLADLTIKDFLAETAGSAPVPGGGSISALNGAIAAALTNEDDRYRGGYDP